MRQASLVYIFAAIASIFHPVILVIRPFWRVPL